MNKFKPVKRSIAVLVRNGDRILAIRRSDDDDELAGIWGLPAGTFRSSETPEDLITRIGRDKLGVRLLPISVLSSGSQERSRYRLEMELWEAQMEGSPKYPEWRWATLDLLCPGAAAGSLCCELALRKWP
jgi:ADP-ribose pyrophosphatase YjhB (NUDIX family)